MQNKLNNLLRKLTNGNVQFVRLDINIPHIHTPFLVEVDSISLLGGVDTHVVLVLLET